MMDLTWLVHSLSNRNARTKLISFAQQTSRPKMSEPFLFSLLRSRTTSCKIIEKSSWIWIYTYITWEEYWSKAEKLSTHQWWKILKTCLQWHAHKARIIINTSNGIGARTGPSTRQVEWRQDSCLRFCGSLRYSGGELRFCRSVSAVITNWSPPFWPERLLPSFKEVKSPSHKTMAL